MDTSLVDNDYWSNVSKGCQHPSSTTQFTLAILTRLTSDKHDSLSHQQSKLSKQGK